MRRPARHRWQRLLPRPGRRNAGCPGVVSSRYAQSCPADDARRSAPYPSVCFFGRARAPPPGRPRDPKGMWRKTQGVPRRSGSAAGGAARRGRATSPATSVPLRCRSGCSAGPVAKRPPSQCATERAGPTVDPGAARARMRFLRLRQQDRVAQNSSHCARLAALDRAGVRGAGGSAARGDLGAVAGTAVGAVLTGWGAAWLAWS